MGRHVDGLEKFLFLVVFLVGVIGIVALKLTGLSQLWVTAFPVIIMSAYAAWLWFSPSPDLGIAGENLYYLGFLYTLTSLGLSLYQFAELGSAQAIISNFGIALGTTAIGVVFRVMFHQTQGDPSRIEREARLGLAQASRRLRAELNQSVLEFNSFRRGLVQLIAEGIQQISIRLTRDFEEAATELSLFTQKIQKTTSELSDLQIRMSETAARCATATDGTVIAVESLSSRIEQIAAPSDLLERKLDLLIRRLMNAVQQSIEKTAKAEEERLRPLKELIDTTALSSNALKGNLEEMSGQVGAFSQALKREREKYQESVDRHMDRLQEMLAAFHRSSDEERNRNLEITSSITTSLRRHFGQMNELMPAMEQASSGLVRSLEEQSDAIRALASNTEQDLITIREHREALEAELKKSRELVREVHGALASMPSLIVERLNGS